MQQNVNNSVVGTIVQTISLFTNLVYNPPHVPSMCCIPQNYIPDKNL